MDEQPTTRGGPLYWLKRRSRRFWIIAAMLPVLYVLSFGPAVWITAGREDEDQIGASVLCIAYRPILVAIRYAPRRISERLRWWAELGIYGRQAYFEFDDSPQGFVWLGGYGYPD